MAYIKRLKRNLQFFTVLFFSIFFIFSPLMVDAYVSVKGYYRKDGTYVSPHVRSNPNGLKYDNYSYKSGDGLYNETYGTRGSTWDTPTYITDPDYYEGKALYEANKPGTSNNILPPTTLTPPETNKNTIKCYDTINGYLGDDDQCYCNSGFSWNDSQKKCTQNTVTKLTCADEINGYLGDDNLCYCKQGYVWNEDGTSCKPFVPKLVCPDEVNGYLGNDNLCYCNEGYAWNAEKSVCLQLNVVKKENDLEIFKDTNVKKIYQCDNGFTLGFDQKTCVKLPPNSHAVKSKTDLWLCDEGYYEKDNKCYPVVTTSIFSQSSINDSKKTNLQKEKEGLFSKIFRNFTSWFF